MYRIRSETVVSSAEKGRIKIVENDCPSSSLFKTGIILLTFYGNINSFKNHE